MLYVKLIEYWPGKMYFCHALLAVCHEWKATMLYYTYRREARIYLLR